MAGLPTTPNGFKHAISHALHEAHPDWPYMLTIDVAGRMLRRWAAETRATSA